MNDRHLLAAFPLPSEPATLDAGIDRALARHVATRRTRRRVLFGTTATAALTVGLVALPAVQAQATLRGIARSLDRQIHARVVTSIVDEEGRRWPNATTIIANGDVAILYVKGRRQHFDIGTKSYDLDPTIGRFIVSPRRPGGSLRLSDLLSGASGFSLGQRVNLQRVDVDGRSILRATILNRNLPERTVIDADPETDLPVRMRVDALERGEWKIRAVSEFDYSAPVTALEPDLRRYPPITPQAAGADFERAMTRETLAELPLKRGRLVVRALDVARDGTVFVAYQSGDGRRHHWSGYAFETTDDLGSRYVHVGDLFSGDGESSPEGAIQMEVFVPREPISPDRARTLRLTTHRWSNGRLARNTLVGVNDPDGHTEWRWRLNAMSSWDVDASVLTILRKQSVATCGAMPTWAKRMDLTCFGNEAWADRIKAQYRAKAAMDAEDWSEAERQVNEELRLIHDAETRGDGSYSRTEALEALDKIRAARRP